jgi:UDP-N-acetylglucosamine 2-epimerase
LVAKQFGVISVCPSHGRVACDANQAFHIADHLAVYGESQRQTLISCGIASARIDVVGAPYLDTLPPQGHQMHPAISARLKVPAATPWVLVALSGAGHLVSHSHHQQTIASLFAACQQLPHVHFVVKLHRKDRPFHYRDCPANIRKRFHVISNNARGFPSSIFDWLQGTSVLLTGASHVAVESMLMQVPVITMDFANELGDTDFIQQQATIHVKTPEQLVRAVKSVIANPDAYATACDRAKQFVERDFYKLDGQASARTAELILRKTPNADDGSAQQLRLKLGKQSANLNS